MRGAGRERNTEGCCSVTPDPACESGATQGTIKRAVHG